MINQVVCLDWLEVYCLEPVSLGAEYWAKLGFKPRVRDYGTPIYREVITLYANQLPFVEIRRNPYSAKSCGGILDDRSCHIKLCNHFLYYSNGIILFADFLKKYRYKVRAISRADIAIDFVSMVDYPDPQRFVDDVMMGKLHRKRRYEFRAFGETGYGSQRFNSLSWGAARSMVGVKLYNKSLEIAETSHKSYIEDFWRHCGLISQLDAQKKNVWRLEFSLRSSVKYFMKKDVYSKGELAIEGPEHELLFCNKKWNLGHIVNIIRGSHSFYLKNNLSLYADYKALTSLAASLVHLYFTFAVFDMHSTRKYPRFCDAKKVKLFEFDTDVMIPLRNDLVANVPMRLPQILASVRAVKNDDSAPMDVRFAAERLYDYFLTKYSLKDHIDLKVADRRLRCCEEQLIPFVVDDVGERFKKDH